jgi:hypothetical protein
MPVPPQIIRDLAPQPHTCRPPKGRPFNKSAYAEKTLNAILKDMEETSEGGRNTKLNALAFRLGRLISQGRMPDWVMQALLEAAISTGLDKTQAERTMQSGYAAGLKKG